MSVPSVSAKAIVQGLKEPGKIDKEFQKHFGEVEKVLQLLVNELEGVIYSWKSTALIYADPKLCRELKLPLSGTSTGLKIGRKVHPRQVSPDFLDALRQAGCRETLLRSLKKHP